MAEGDARAAMIAALERANAEVGYPLLPGIQTNVMADALGAAGYVLVSQGTATLMRDLAQFAAYPGGSRFKEIAEALAELDRVLGGRGG